MNFKKNWKRFWTRSSAREGFTLVELIVVIAILAILAGVAVPAYSGYVTKANKQADMTLASEVAHALTLAYYNQKLPEGGYVVLSKDGAEASAEDVEAALTAAFGDTWETSDVMKLKYDGWSSVAASANVAAIPGSSFSENSLPSLLESVSGLTNVLNDLWEGERLGTPAMLKEYAAANGMDPSTMSSQELANLMPMVIAQNMSNKMSETITTDGTSESGQSIFESLYSNEAYMFTGGALASQLMNSNLGMDKWTAYAVEYAQVEGMLNYFATNGTEEDKLKGQELLAQWKEDTKDLAENGVGSGTQMANTLLGDIKMSIATSFGEDALLAYINSDKPRQDAQAFAGYMEGLNETAPTLIQNAESLKDADYYKSSTISDTVLSYLDASQTLTAANISGSVGFVFIDKNGNVQILLSE